MLFILNLQGFLVQIDNFSSQATFQAHHNLFATEEVKEGFQQSMLSAVERQKLRPGSGALNFAVEKDGPTRVIRIVDVEHPPRRNLLNHILSKSMTTTQHPN
jgi:hypothetical protein